MAKGKGKWVVAVRKGADTTVTVLFEGPDRVKARAAIERALGSGQKEVQVWRVTRSATVTPADLVSSLPRNSF